MNRLGVRGLRAATSRAENSGLFSSLSHLKNADGDFQRSDIISLIESNGLKSMLKGSLKSIQDNRKETWSETEFEEIFFNLCPRSQDLLSRTVNDNLAVANWETFTNDLEDIFNSTKSCPLTYEGIEGEFKFSSGKTETCLIPDYIPQLARANKEALAVSVCTVDGQRFHVGDYHTWYSMQSTSKPFFYSIAHALLGDELHDYVGHEPSGRAFNDICLDNYNRPFNPMINMGAIMVTSLIKPEMILADRFDFIRKVISEFSAGRHVFCDMETVFGFILSTTIYKSEMEVGYGNKAAINYMMNMGCFKRADMTDADLAEILDLYYQLCSLEVTVKTQSIMGACLANDGINPLNFKRIIPKNSTMRTLSLMFSCGMYDYSGKFAFKYGVPAKSGVSGATMIVIPGVLSMTIYNPWLGKESSSSVKAIEFIDQFNKKYPFHMFQNSKSFSNERSFEADICVDFT